MQNAPPLGVSLSLAGRNALITGGSRGIGAATVRLFRQAGARVAFSFQSAGGEAQRLAAECGGPGLCDAIQQTLNTLEDGQALVASAVAALGTLDCLIVNHGVWPAHDAPIASMSPAQWRSTLATNLESVFGLVQAGVAQMQVQAQGRAQLQDQDQDQDQAQGQGHGGGQGQAGAEAGPRGHVVLVASTAAQRGEAFHADYAASKGALIALTKSLSSELAGSGIYCNCVAPGWVATEMSAAAFKDPETSNRIRSAIPIGRPAHVDEIAGPILFLCTPFAGFVSGEIFNVNGGAVLTG